MNYKESYLKRQNRLVPRWAESRNSKFPISNFDKLPKGYKRKRFIIKIFFIFIKQGSPILFKQ